MEQKEMPIGFAMALAMNTEAMKNFSALSEDKKQELIDATHSLKTRDEMRRFVNSIE